MDENTNTTTNVVDESNSNTSKEQLTIIETGGDPIKDSDSIGRSWSQPNRDTQDNYAKGSPAPFYVRELNGTETPLADDRPLSVIALGFEVLIKRGYFTPGKVECVGSDYWKELANIYYTPIGKIAGKDEWQLVRINTYCAEMDRNADPALYLRDRFDGDYPSTTIRFKYVDGNRHKIDRETIQFDLATASNQYEWAAVPDDVNLYHAETGNDRVPLNIEALFSNFRELVVKMARGSEAEVNKIFIPKGGSKPKVVK